MITKQMMLGVGSSMLWDLQKSQYAFFWVVFSEIWCLSGLYVFRSSRSFQFPMVGMCLREKASVSVPFFHHQPYRHPKCVSLSCSQGRGACQTGLLVTHLSRRCGWLSNLFLHAWLKPSPPSHPKRELSAIGEDV
jgi:hypothetical protein